MSSRELRTNTGSNYKAAATGSSHSQMLGAQLSQYSDMVNSRGRKSTTQPAEAENSNIKIG